MYRSELVLWYAAQVWSPAEEEFGPVYGIGVNLGVSVSAGFEYF